MTETEAIKGIITSVLKLEAQEVSSMGPDEPLNTVGMDSINCMDIVIQIEEHFGVVFHDDELLLDQLNTISKLSEIVMRKLDKPSAGIKEEEACR
ncbi:acyl carrier protein [Paenibacillus hexagrammi]|uniref:Acyl carrier protein n=1 Tax=Paenibacillus hexagrammi TaxID=2908839 RepID=A0ABY3SKB7_9BACL|nr:acyl carrier protein [Paenibacillus sp. YPD9-1]UJF34492.1 acyl carrier protein [Paenibacillus sp. YPD9-1]